MYVWSGDKYQGCDRSKLHSECVLTIRNAIRTTLVSSGKDQKSTLVSSGEDPKNTLVSSGEDPKNTLVSSGEDAECVVELNQDHLGGVLDPNYSRTGTPSYSSVR
jgi:hypothetical protein